MNGATMATLPVIERSEKTVTVSLPVVLTGIYILKITHGEGYRFRKYILE